MQQCIQPTGTNRPRAWRPTRARARFGTLRGCGNAASGVALSVNVSTAGRAPLSARFPVAMAAGKHPFPFRTRQLSPPAPMVLGGRPPGRVGRRRDFSRNPLRALARGGFVRSGPSCQPARPAVRPAAGHRTPPAPLRYCGPCRPPRGAQTVPGLSDGPAPAGAPDAPEGHRRGTPRLDATGAPVRPVLRRGGLPGGRPARASPWERATSTRRSSAICWSSSPSGGPGSTSPGSPRPTTSTICLYRLLTFVQIIGVLILAAGVDSAFTAGNFTVMTIGYVVMRIAMVAQWLRAAAGDPAARPAALRYAACISILQVGWVVRLFLPQPEALWVFYVLGVGEMLVPVLRRAGRARWRHAVAPRAHRRALRAVHADRAGGVHRRGDGGAAQCEPVARHLGGAAGGRRRRRAPRLRHLVVVLREPGRGGPAPVSPTRLHLGLRPLRRPRITRCAGRRAAAGGSGLARLALVDDGDHGRAGGGRAGRCVSHRDRGAAGSPRTALGRPPARGGGAPPS